MKKLILLLVLSYSLFASNLDIEKKIYRAIIYSIFPNKQTISIWSDDIRKNNFLSSLHKIRIVKEPSSADMLIIEKPLKTLPDKILFITSYPILEKYKNKAIGGFYWQKGRPNIIFLDKNLKRFDIKLPDSMQEYIEDEL